MNQGKFIFAQLTDFLPRSVFDRIVKKHEGQICQVLYPPTVFQMDEAASEDKNLLKYNLECSKNPNVLCDHR